MPSHDAPAPSESVSVPFQLEAEAVAPDRWLNYRGDQTGCVGQEMGPTYEGEILTVVFARHDKATDRTRVGLVASGHITEYGPASTAFIRPGTEAWWANRRRRATAAAA